MQCVGVVTQLNLAALLKRQERLGKAALNSSARREADEEARLDHVEQRYKRGLAGVSGDSPL